MVILYEFLCIVKDHRRSSIKNPKQGSNCARSCTFCGLDNFFNWLNFTNPTFDAPPLLKSELWHLDESSPLFLSNTTVTSPYLKTMPTNTSNSATGLIVDFPSPNGSTSPHVGRRVRFAAKSQGRYIRYFTSEEILAKWYSEQEQKQFQIPANHEARCDQMFHEVCRSCQRP